MDETLDRVLCRGMTFECEVGFHACELHIPQRILLDLTAWVRPIPKSEREQPSSIQFDYYDANRDIKEFLTGRRFNLIETLCEELADRLLDRFRVEAVEVSLTKYPLDMANVESVGYVCLRRRDKHG